TGVGTTPIYNVRAEDTSTGALVQGDLTSAVLTESSHFYVLTLPAGSYIIKVFTDSEDKLCYRSPILTVPQNVDEGLTHDISID
ncbi:MAG: hypothetical protein WDA26_11350, partial [Pusillimonas sp.]